MKKPAIGGLCYCTDANIGIAPLASGYIDNLRRHEAFDRGGFSAADAGVPGLRNITFAGARVVATGG